MRKYYNNDIDISQWIDSMKETGVYGVYFSLKRPRISREERKNIISFLINKVRNDLYVIVINWKADCKQAIDLLQSGHNL